MTKRLWQFALLSIAFRLVLSAQVTALRVGHLVDPETGTVRDNQVILVENGNFGAIGANVSIPPGAQVIDLSQMYVSPGLVDAHNHLALTQKLVPEGDQYYLTTVLDSTVIRGIQAVSNGFSMLASGFTMERDLGNNGNYADTALRVAIDQGWVPGPTIINSGLIIGGFGGQLNPVPEREMLIYPEYLNADTTDEIVKAVRRNILFGARVIKICVDCKAYGYTVDEIKLFVSEAAKAGLKVAGHSQSKAGVMRGIQAGIWSIEHCGGCDDEAHRLMAEKGIWRVGTEFPLIDYDTMTVFNRINPKSPQAQARYKRQEESLKSAYANHVKMGFSSDADYYIPGKTRGQVVIDFLKSWKDADIPAAQILKIMTTNGYQICDIADRRGPIKTGLPADLIAVSGNPLQDIDTLKDVRFVLKDGMVFKQDGVVLAEKFFHGGPVYGGRGGRGGRGR
jgi:imidazolonepropionase-like amidohydrolase